MQWFGIDAPSWQWLRRECVVQVSHYQNGTGMFDFVFEQLVF